MAEAGDRVPKDQAQRDRIAKALDRNLLVEAAAGTGKTRSMVGRMIRLLAAGKCKDTLSMAAVTFTRKAAAELRARFQVELERAVREDGLPAPARARLEKALEEVEQCFIGTIHSFCARLLRERPVEGRVDVAFREVDDGEDRRIRQEAWEAYTAELYAREDPILDELNGLGREIGLLKGAYLFFTDYPDVDEWPAPRIRLPDTGPVKEELRRYVQHMDALVPDLPFDPGNDELMPSYRRVPRVWAHADLDDPVDLMEVLGLFRKVKIVQKNWPGGRDQAKKEEARWNEFREMFALPLGKAWREHRYGAVMGALLPARDCFDRMRRDLGVLNYQDLLMKAAALLRTGGGVREYFRSRYTHLLVDEFQDTDPVQAEIILLLTADDPEERAWTRCRPRAGSLFVVGDPKQSIYRFRRADIVTYNRVKKIIREAGGEVVHLWCNFRTKGTVVDWINRTFQGEFPEAPTDESPAYVPLEEGRSGERGGSFSGVKVLRLQGANVEEAVEEEADFIARSIRGALDEKARISGADGGAGERVVTPGDFLIVTWKTRHLSTYARALQTYGLPHQVSGGSALNQVKELSLLHRCLDAVIQPENPIALAGVLRSELFGLSDQALYAFKQGGGTFSFRAPLPEGLDPLLTETFESAFQRLERYASWLVQVPPVAAFERVAADLGLPVRAMAAPGGNVLAGSLWKALELLRSAQAAEETVADLVDHLGRLVKEEERYDGIPARPMESSGVRVMNLHKSKGLEGAVVYLSEPSGKGNQPVGLHIDRSGDRVLGYLPVYEESRGFSSREMLLAQPPGWEALEERERAFLHAEEIRLLYVAATRAGVQLNIVQREKGNHTNPWRFFEERLADRPSLEDPGEVARAAPEDVPVSLEAARKGEEARKAPWKRAAQPTHAKAAAKAVSMKPVVPEGTRGEHGTEWGAAVHLLLEAAMTDPSLDLNDLAASVLLDQGLDPALRDEAVETVGRVRGSSIWKRAEKSPRRLVEVPLQVLLAGEGDAGTPLPTLLRGVIDLVFEEKGGWVIVDYKTDRSTEGSLDGLVEKYRLQIRNYRTAWQDATGEKVIETGLFFTSADTYVPVSS